LVRRKNGGRLDSSGDGFGMAENRLLIVDDDPRIARLALRVANKLGYQAEALGRSTEFERRYATFKPDVVLLDLNMPGMDGIELLRFLADRNSRAAICQ
jgi:CheY-like chemotaxis protein